MSNNFFEEVLTNPKKVEQELLGPDYQYFKKIRTPKQLGMSDNGSLSSLGEDINGLVAYIELLVAGGGDAQKVNSGGGLGNRFFLKTGGQCKDIKTGKKVDRFVYMNNIPLGNIPFISSGLGENFSSFRGLVPGALSDLNVLNPFALFQSFMAGSTPKCQEVTLCTADAGEGCDSETHYIATADIANMDACIWGSNGKNPISGDRCSEAFQNMNETDKSQLPPDLLVKAFYGSMGVLGLYILYCLFKKQK